MKHTFLLSSLLFLSACGGGVSENVKIQSNRDNIIDVKDKVKIIDFKDVYIGNTNNAYMVGNYLAIVDTKSLDNKLHLFDSETFEHIVSTAPSGQGPGECVNPGPVADNKHGELYLTDFGKYQIMAYNIDSLIKFPDYKPYIKFTLTDKAFPADYYYVNDTFCFCETIIPTSESTFRQCSGIWNMRDGGIINFENGIEDHLTRASLSVLPSDSIFVECYFKDDLMRFCNYKGELQYSVQGPHYGRTYYMNFYSAVFTKDYLCGLYVDDEYNNYSQPKFIHIFKKNGDYLATLDLGFQTFRFCYDERHNRLIFCLINEIDQFAYLDLDDIKL